MKAELPLHSTGVLFLHTGSNNAGRPSLGSWVNYGLGSENENLPGFVVLSFGVVPCGGLENFSNGFLPGQPPGHPPEGRRHADRQHRPRRRRPPHPADQARPPRRPGSSPSPGRLGDDDAVEAAIKNYEMAYRMQSLVPDVLDLGRETRGDEAALRHRFATCRRSGSTASSACGPAG